MTDKVKVLFVCMGNICRSPTAHVSFQSLVANHNLTDKVEVDSAGTHSYHVGQMPDGRAQQVAKERGMDMINLRARQLQASDLNTFDYILVMDKDNLEMTLNLSEVNNRHKVKLFLQFATGDWGSLEVPDPYYGGEEGFERVFDMIEDASKGLLQQITQGEKWN